MNAALKRVIFFCFFLTVMLIAVNSFVRYLLLHCPQGSIAKVNAVMLHQLDKDITIWGASTARVHFDADMIQEELGRSCFNVGLDGTPFHQYAGLLNEYIDYTEKGKLLVLAIDINGLARRSALYQGYAWLHYTNNVNMYEALKSVDRDLVIKSRFVPLYYLTTYDRRFLGRCLKWVYIGPDEEPELNHAGFHPNDVPWQEKQHRSYDKPFNVSIEDEIINKIRMTIQKANKKNMEVLIVVPPCYHEAKKRILNLDKFENVLRSLEQEENVRLLSYLDRPLCMNRNYFSNNTHLNSIGASAFTQEFCKDLKILLQESVVNRNTLDNPLSSGSAQSQLVR